MQKYDNEYEAKENKNQTGWKMKPDINLHYKRFIMLSFILSFPEINTTDISALLSDEKDLGWKHVRSDPFKKVHEVKSAYISSTFTDPLEDNIISCQKRNSLEKKVNNRSLNACQKCRFLFEECL